ncbi:MAG TPA: CRTAC1 family protein [Vicinamibacterales bacterium]|nr:CRTAC1 family protein [Vicinamibacterales bacterium]
MAHGRHHRLLVACALSAAAAAGVLAQRGAPASPVQPAARGAIALADGTREMAAELARRAQALGPGDLWFNINDKRADAFGKDVDTPRPVTDALRARHVYANELLFAGRYAEAIAQTDRLLEQVDQAGPDIGAEAFINVLMLRATVYLRWGEEQNCVDGVNGESCLLPIAGGGIHKQRDGATRAKETLERLLRVDPDNLRARWLLNIANMTLGTYPDGVPPELRIGPAAFTSPYPLPRFTSVASEVGLGIHGVSGGSVIEDLDGDGLLDVVVSAIGFGDQIRLFRNTGTGTFEERTANSGLDGINGGLNLVHTDFDNDGRPDILVLRGGWMGAAGQFPVSLLRNLGGWRFADVTRAAGLGDVEGPTQTAAWFDYDGDGWLDLFIGREATVLPKEHFASRLFHSNRDGTFTDVTAASGIDVVGFVKAAVPGDYDNDGRPDLYLSQARAPNRLLHNDGPQAGGGWRFSDTTAKAGVAAPNDSFPAMWFDYDNDGWLDVYVGGYLGQSENVAADFLGIDHKADRSRLYHNRGDGTFADVTREAGLWHTPLVMGLNYGDLDNDGWLDFYEGTGNPDFHTLVPNRMFRNDGGKRFQEVTTAGNFGHLQKGHGIAFADVDNDGDQDVFEKMGGAYQADRAYSVLFENPHATAAAPAPKADWIGLELEGTTANRAALGARVTVRLQTPAGPRRLHRVVSTGGSFGSSPFRIFAGIGDATAVTAVDVSWPVARTGAAPVPPQSFRGLVPGRHYLLKQGAAAPVELKRPAIALSHAPPAPHVHDAR